MACRSVNPNSRTGQRPYARHIWEAAVVNGHSRERCIRCLKLNPVGIPPAVRFWDHVQKAPGDGCWIWTGDKINSGYGRFTVNRKKILAHRYAWSKVFRDIPDGLVIDHLCRVLLCVRPSHLEPVVIRENLWRGEHGSRWGRCGQGHKFEGTDVRTYVSRGGKVKHRCLICHPYKRVHSKEVRPKS